MLQRAEEKFRINQVVVEKDWWVTAEMCNHFIYGQTLSFEKLLERSKELQDRFRKAF